MKLGSRRIAIAASASLAVALVAPGARAGEPTPAADDDPLDAQRERFRAGLERYRAGAFAEAILIWETIYAELGQEKGYRLAFNLGRAYEQFGNSTRAAESYEAYVREVARRRDAGETLEPVVEKQELEAKERLIELAATQGRIRIAGARAVVVKIDGGADRLAPATGFVAYVSPNRNHTVTFDPGTKDEKQVSVLVEIGKVIELAPPALAVTPARADPTPPLPPPPTPRFEVREERPFGKTVLYVAAGATAVSVIVPIVLYANAGSAQSDYDAARRQAEASRSADDYAAALERSKGPNADYMSARDAAYASLAIPAVLGAATIGLAAYWLLGTRETRVPITATVLPGGAATMATARF